jgi:ribosomal-protein-alanine N-acetyltransferase
MIQPPLLFRIEPMTLADIREVIAVERASYSLAWPAKAYDYELQKNDLAHYFVLRLLPPPASQPLADLSNRPHNQPTIQPTNRPSRSVIGLGGFWLMADEIHISTIAVQPIWRGLGLGEWLLVKLLVEGQALGGAIATLEVRPSNQAALALYRKYNFQEVGRRPHYYNDNGEDALILTTPNLSLPDYQAMFQQRQAALNQRLVKIRADTITRRRFGHNESNPLTGV